MFVVAMTLVSHYKRILQELHAHSRRANTMEKTLDHRNHRQVESSKEEEKYID